MDQYKTNMTLNSHVALALFVFFSISSFRILIFVFCPFWWWYTCYICSVEFKIKFTRNLCKKVFSTSKHCWKKKYKLFFRGDIHEFTNSNEIARIFRVDMNRTFLRVCAFFQFIKWNYKLQPFFISFLLKHREWV